MSITTSGNVSTYNFDFRKVLDHAFRRAGHAPESVPAEFLEIGKDLTFSITSEWINAGFPLWTRQFFLLGPTIGSPDVPCPIGTVDVFHTYWRILNPYRGAAQDNNGNDVSVLFGGQPNSDVTLTGPNPSVIVSFGSATEVDTIGIVAGGTHLPISQTGIAVEIQTSDDGITYTTVQTLPSATYPAQQWTYFDLNPSVTAAWIKIVFPQNQAIKLNQVNFGLANGEDIEAGPLNIDDYYNLPNKMFQSDRAVSCYVDRQLTTPVIKLWPTVDTGGFYNGCISVLARRYIQDPGALTQNVEVPQRWLEALIWRLASTLIYELPDPGPTTQPSYFTLMAKQQRIQQIEQKASKSEMLAWSEERTRAPIRWVPNIGPYTR